MQIMVIDYDRCYKSLASKLISTLVPEVKLESMVVSGRRNDEVDVPTCAPLSFS